MYGEGCDGAGLGALLAAVTEAPPAPADLVATDDTAGGMRETNVTAQAQPGREGGKRP